MEWVTQRSKTIVSKEPLDWNQALEFLIFESKTIWPIITTPIWIS
jgi:hypothetical protein